MPIKTTSPQVRAGLARLENEIMKFSDDRQAQFLMLMDAMLTGAAIADHYSFTGRNQIAPAPPAPRA